MANRMYTECTEYDTSENPTIIVKVHSKNIFARCRSGQNGELVTKLIYTSTICFSVV